MNNENRINELTEELIDLKYSVIKERYKEYINKSFYCHLGLILNIKEIIRPDKVTDVFYIEVESISSDKYKERIIKVQLDYSDGLCVWESDKKLHYAGIDCEPINDDVKAQILYYFDIVNKKYWEHHTIFNDSKKKVAKIIEESLK